MSDVALDCFHPHPQLALDERIWCVWVTLQNRKMSSCCMAFFTVLSCHTCSVQSMCAHAGDDLTQKLLVKKQHRLGSHSPQCGSSTPGYLSTVLGNTCPSHTPLSAQCLEFCGGNNYMQMQPQWNVQEVMNPHPVVLPARYHLSFGCAAWQKSPDLQVRV